MDQFGFLESLLDRKDNSTKKKKHLENQKLHSFSQTQTKQHLAGKHK